jgi:hypothetical protein
MSPTTTALLRAGAVAIAPLVLLGAFVWHPFLPGRLPNDAAIAAAVAADPTRWGLAHVAAVVASAFVALAFVAVRACLRDAGEGTWSALGLPLVVIGSTLYALLPGMEFAPLAAVETGADAQAAQAALGPWFLPVLITGALTFGLGCLAFANGIVRSGVLGPRIGSLVVVALAVVAVTRFVPLAAVQFYVQSVALMVALWPLAAVMRTQPLERRAGQVQRASAR